MMNMTDDGDEQGQNKAEMLKRMLGSKGGQQQAGGMPNMPQMMGKMLQGAKQQIQPQEDDEGNAFQQGMRYRYSNTM